MAGGTEEAEGTVVRFSALRLNTSKSKSTLTQVDPSKSTRPNRPYWYYTVSLITNLFVSISFLIVILINTFTF